MKVHASMLACCGVILGGQVHSGEAVAGRSALPAGVYTAEVESAPVLSKKGKKRGSSKGVRIGGKPTPSPRNFDRRPAESQVGSGGGGGASSANNFDRRPAESQVGEATGEKKLKMQQARDRLAAAQAQAAQVEQEKKLIGELRLRLDRGDTTVDAQATNLGGWLHYAAANNMPDAVRFLLSRGADPSLRNSQGLTPAELARRMGHTSTLQVLAADP